MGVREAGQDREGEETKQSVISGKVPWSVALTLSTGLFTPQGWQFAPMQKNGSRAIIFLHLSVILQALLWENINPQASLAWQQSTSSLLQSLLDIANLTCPKLLTLSLTPTALPNPSTYTRQMLHKWLYLGVIHESSLFITPLSIHQGIRLPSPLKCIQDLLITSTATP